MKANPRSKKMITYYNIGYIFIYNLFKLRHKFFKWLYRGYSYIENGLEEKMLVFVFHWDLIVWTQVTSLHVIWWLEVKMIQKGESNGQACKEWYWNVFNSNIKKT